MGARAKMVDDARVTLDVKTDRAGEYFEIRLAPGTELVPLEVKAADRHLLLLTRDGEEKARFLCGHDERSWFVAAIPESEPVSTVAGAMDALKPELVRDRQRSVPTKLRQKRRNPASIRQGEWFFVPAPYLSVDSLLVLRHEPFTRSDGGTPHVAEEAFRRGGETVHLPQVPGRDAELANSQPELANGLTDKEHAAFLKAHPKARYWGWNVMRRNPEMFVRGRITHRDHKTVVLREWHQVLMNTEPRAKARAKVVFLD